MPIIVRHDSSCNVGPARQIIRMSNDGAFFLGAERECRIFLAFILSAGL